MALSMPRLAVALLVMLLSAMLSRADSPQGRSPQGDTGGESATLHFYTPTPSHTIPDWYTTTTTASQSTASVLFTLGDVPDMAVCGQSNITWTMSGDTSYIMGIAAMPVSSDDRPSIVTILDGGLGIGYYSWNPVNVPAGEYVLEVAIPNADVLYYSKTFYVSDSSDQSCLVSVSSSATLAPTSSPGTATSSGTSSVSAGDASGTAVVGAVSNGSSLSGGGVAGVVIGGVIFVGALIAVFIYLARCRSGRATGAPRGGLFEKRRPKGAVSIKSRGGSFSSGHGFPARGVGNSAFGMAPQYTLNDPSQSDFGHGISYDDVRSSSITGEKYLAHEPVGLGKAPSAVLHRSPRTYRDSLSSVASGSTTAAGSPKITTNHYQLSRHQSVPHPLDPFSSNPPTPSPRPSGEYQGQVPVALFSPTSADSTPHSYGSPGVPRDISIDSSSLPDFEHELEVATPPAVATASTIPRRAPPAPPTTALASSQSSGKRAKSASARKPVPVYEPSIYDEPLELVEPSTPRSSSARSSSGTSASYYNSNLDRQSRGSLGQSSSTGNDWSFAAAHSHASASGSAGSQHSRGSGHSGLGLAGRGEIPELNHKSSFGDRQMHVIMPDPPSREMQ